MEFQFEKSAKAIKVIQNLIDAGAIDAKMAEMTWNDKRGEMILTVNR